MAKKSGPTIKELISAGLISPPLEIEKNYRGVSLKATILKDGTVKFEGKIYNSFSMAASKAKQGVGGEYRNTNGWSFWRYVDKKNNKLEKMQSLRSKL